MVDFKYCNCNIIDKGSVIMCKSGTRLEFRDLLNHIEFDSTLGGKLFYMKSNDTYVKVLCYIGNDMFKVKNLKDGTELDTDKKDIQNCRFKRDIFKFGDKIVINIENDNCDVMVLTLSEACLKVRGKSMQEDIIFVDDLLNYTIYKL